MSMPSVPPSSAEAPATATVTAKPEGLVHHLLGWLDATLHYVLLRGQLALVEAKEAGAHYGVIAGLFIGALIVVLFAYVFLILTIVFALAEWMDGTTHVWLKILGGATGVHLVLAVVLAVLAKSRLKAGVFEQTKEEFRKDKLWTKAPAPTTPPPPPPPQI